MDVFLSSTVFACNTVGKTVIPRLHDTTGCQAGLRSVLNEQPLFVQPVVKPGCTTGLATGCIHDTARNRLYRVNGALG